MAKLNAGYGFTRMKKKLKLLAVLAHPDDESLGFGGTLARYADEGIETYLVTATRGEAGRFGALGRSGDPAELGPVREAELRAAAGVLGIHEVTILGYPDAAVDRVPFEIAIRDIGSQIRRIQPHVIVTFGPDGAYGHPDHIAVSQFTTAAILCAADSEYVLDKRPQSVPVPSHRVAKLYHLALRNDKWETYQAVFRKLTSTVDGIEREAISWPDWAVTTVVDTSTHWRTVWEAVCRHHTQMSIYERLESLSQEQQIALWGSQEFYRVFSSVNGGRKLETDLFEGLR
jgi:LmbE family N-acetylglucosaminyl deacetylase